MRGGMRQVVRVSASFGCSLVMLSLGVSSLWSLANTATWWTALALVASGLLGFALLSALLAFGGSSGRLNLAHVVAASWILIPIARRGIATFSDSKMVTALVVVSVMGWLYLRPFRTSLESAPLATGSAAGEGKECEL